MIKTHEELKRMPIIINGNFGHVNPISTIPIGAECKIICDDKKVNIEIIK